MTGLVDQGLDAFRRTAPKIVIHAPDFTHLNSGVRCLHLLCNRLNQLGIRSAVTSGIVAPGSRTPRIAEQRIRRQPSLLDRSIVIYPEVTAGNPLLARNVVRYLLNKPGFFTGSGLEAFGRSDYFIHFADEFLPSGLSSRLVRLPLVDTKVFVAPRTAAGRHGFIVYADRYKPDTRTFPGWANPLIAVSRDNARTPPDMARLYRTSRALIAGERTAALTEALHCHCPVILLTQNALEQLSRFKGHGALSGFDEARLPEASREAESFPAIYAAQYQNTDQQILDFVADAAKYFALDGFLER
jgi:hypothetical protein